MYLKKLEEIHRQPGKEIICDETVYNEEAVSGVEFDIRSWLDVLNGRRVHYQASQCDRGDRYIGAIAYVLDTNLKHIYQHLACTMQNAIRNPSRGQRPTGVPLFNETVPQRVESLFIDLLRGFIIDILEKRKDLGPTDTGEVKVEHMMNVFCCPSAQHSQITETFEETAKSVASDVVLLFNQDKVYTTPERTEVMQNPFRHIFSAPPPSYNTLPYTHDDDPSRLSQALSVANPNMFLMNRLEFTPPIEDNPMIETIAVTDRPPQYTETQRR